MLEVQFISSMEKCFLDQTPKDFAALKKLRMYKNERASVQFIVYNGEEAEHASRFYLPCWEGGLSPFIKGRMVENVPNYMAAYATPKLIEWGIPPREAFYLASGAPAEYAGLTTKGKLLVGCDADMILVDDAIVLQQTIVAGVTEYVRGH